MTYSLLLKMLRSQLEQSLLTLSMLEEHQSRMEVPQPLHLHPRHMPNLTKVEVGDPFERQVVETRGGAVGVPPPQAGSLEGNTLPPPIETPTIQPELEDIFDRPAARMPEYPPQSRPNLPNHPNFGGGPRL